MTVVTHIRANKTDAAIFKRWAKKKGLTSSKAFKLLVRRLKA